PRLDTSEFETRKKYIDVDLKYQGWEFEKNWFNEFEVDTMAGIDGQSGFADYVLFGKDGKPLAVIEAKKTCKDPNIGKQQCKLYADSLERKYGRRPVMFYTNGFETYFWDDLAAPPRQVSTIFSESDIQRLIDRRENKKDLRTIPVDDKITNRYYQKEAIRAVCDNFQNGIRKSLLVMATGTGKTRTAVSLVDVLSRGGHILNVLFLADRTPLVDQAEEAFENNLKDISRCNLLKNKKDTSARIIFSTYPTILNTIDKIENGKSRFSPAHFDLIILDEAHRSIFKKYRAIFDYFDACLLGLTATPKDEIDRNTYDFFETEPDVPTFAYDYETAVYKDRYLVPYHNIEVKTQFLEEGIYYDDLSEEDKERFEEDFTEDFEGAEFIPSAALNRFIFNQNTVDIVLNDLMENGIKTAGGDRIGKTIIFAQNKIHAQFITERFDKLYPQYKGLLARRIVHEDNYAKTLITDFKQPEKNPHIAVSVDMMDTGVDVPEVVNLVFFKKVRSKTKFWQMIGRGTRLCPDLECIDGQNGEYRGKKYFYIF
ncbi:DEAD/DEAH box helicase family protein, partial [Methanocorpusculaceae archaeon]|nr:DEAD/DEAH box helicase family protein [Methanocorpusculaceae archaeon]